MHGDDLVICSAVQIDAAKLVPWIEKLGMKIKVGSEHYYPSGEDKVHFIGSEWVEGQPERSILRMCLSAVHLKSRWPVSEVGQDNLVEGRLYTVFGYDRRLPTFWKR